MDMFPWMKDLGSLLPWFLLIILVFDKLIIPLYINWKKDRRFTLKTQKLQLGPAPHNPGVKPGDGTTCKDNRDKIIGLETSVENIEDDIKEMKKNNRQDHEKIFEKIDKIKDKRR